MEDLVSNEDDLIIEDDTPVALAVGLHSAESVKYFPSIDQRDSFYDWFSSQRPSDPVLDGEEAILRFEFFARLLVKGHCLCIDHMREVLFHFRKRLCSFPTRYSDIVILDPLLVGLISHATLENEVAMLFCLSRLRNYICGNLPEKYGKRWTGVQTIYSPLYIDQKHWIALEISLSSRTIRAFSSPCIPYTSDFMSSELRNVCMVFSRLLKDADMYVTSDDSPFILADHIKLNTGGTLCSCGIHTLGVIEVLAFGGDMALLRDEFDHALRERMSVFLYAKNWSFM